VTPDLVPPVSTGEGLAEKLISRFDGQPVRILRPRSDEAPPDLTDRLRESGATVDDVVAYCTIGVAPSDQTRTALSEGLDAIVFCSPSAVRQFVDSGLSPGNASMVCIGPTTAAAMKGVGFADSATAAEPTTEGLTRAILAELSRRA
jgi:uroporphyrinogen-III synthase